MDTHGWKMSFQGLHLCVLFIFLMLWRYQSRRALWGRLRATVRHAVGAVCVFLSQWWSILFIALSVELGFTIASAVEVFRGADLLGGNAGWLGKMSLGIFPACVVTYLLSVIAIARQICAAWNDNSRGIGWQHNLSWVLQWSRDVAVQVLFMPMVYNLMMCRSVLHQWSALTGRHSSDIAMLDVDPHVKIALSENLATANASLAEMYDAYALWCFGNLGMRVVDHELRRAAGGPSGDASSADEFADALVSRLVDEGVSTASGQQAVLRVLRESREELRVVRQETFSLLSVLHSTLLFGVKAYVVTAIGSAVYLISIAYINIAWDPGLCIDPDVGSAVPIPNATDVHSASWSPSGHQVASAWCVFENVIYGADFATSTIAIYNLFYFEQQLHRQLRRFKPGLKFWSMKIPVTLAFSEIIFLKLVKPWTGLTDSEINILDASSKGYFMVFVALLNICAWDPAEEWYDWPEVRECQTDEIASSELLAAESETGSDDDETELPCFSPGSAYTGVPGSGKSNASDTSSTAPPTTASRGAPSVRF